MLFIRVSASLLCYSASSKASSSPQKDTQFSLDELIPPIHKLPWSAFFCWLRCTNSVRYLGSTYRLGGWMNRILVDRHIICIALALLATSYNFLPAHVLCVVVYPPSDGWWGWVPMLRWEPVLVHNWWKPQGCILKIRQSYRGKGDVHNILVIDSLFTIQELHMFEWFSWSYAQHLIEHWWSNYACYWTIFVSSYLLILSRRSIFSSVICPTLIQ